jgi:hypothetical protein
MSIKKLDWDSVFFNLEIGSVTIHNESDFNPLNFLNEAKLRYDLIYVFSFQKPLSFDTVFLANLELVDIMLTMSMPFRKEEYINNDYSFRNTLTQKELADCYEIAEQTAEVSRFYKEKKIGIENTKKLYRKWIDNAFSGVFSDGLFVSNDLDTTKGVHLIKTDRANNVGYFTLTGVNKNLKKSGIGRQLWEQSYGYFANETDIEIIKSPFSFLNTDSHNFHLKMGFNKIEEIKYIYHFRNDKKADIK